MMQATVVLLIHLAVGPVPVRLEQAQEGGCGPAHPFNPSEAVITSCKKVLHWLHHMANINLSCKRGFEICHCLLYWIASPKGLDLEDVQSPSSLKQDPPNDPIFPRPTPVSEGSGYAADYPSFVTQDLAMGSDSSEILPLSLLAGSDMRGVLSMEELDQIHNHLPVDDPPGRTSRDTTQDNSKIETNIPI